MRPAGLLLIAILTFVPTGPRACGRGSIASCRSNGRRGRLREVQGLDRVTASRSATSRSVGGVPQGAHRRGCAGGRSRAAASRHRPAGPAARDRSLEPHPHLAEPRIQRQAERVSRRDGPGCHARSGARRRDGSGPQRHLSRSAGLDGDRVRSGRQGRRRGPSRRPRAVVLRSRRTCSETTSSISVETSGTSSSSAMWAPEV